VVRWARACAQLRRWLLIVEGGGVGPWGPPGGGHPCSAPYVPTPRRHRPPAISAITAHVCTVPYTYWASYAAIACSSLLSPQPLTPPPPHKLPRKHGCAHTRDCLAQGSLVRAVRRLEELLRQLKDALEGVGETALAARFDEASTRMRRDIIFAASLYL